MRKKNNIRKKKEILAKLRTFSSETLVPPSILRVYVVSFLLVLFCFRQVHRVLSYMVHLMNVNVHFSVPVVVIVV